MVCPLRRPTSPPPCRPQKVGINVGLTYQGITLDGVVLLFELEDSWRLSQPGEVKGSSADLGFGKRGKKWLRRVLGRTRDRKVPTLERAEGMPPRHATLFFTQAFQLTG